MSAQQYEKVMKEHTVIRGTAGARMVERVGRRISAAVERYLASQNQSQLLQGYSWEFNLIEDKSENAWAMPGGKVALYQAASKRYPNQALPHQNIFLSADLSSSPDELQEAVFVEVADDELADLDDLRVEIEQMQLPLKVFGKATGARHHVFEAVVQVERRCGH